LSLLKPAQHFLFVFFGNRLLSQIKNNISSIALNIYIIINFGCKHVKLWTQFEAEQEMDCKNFCM